MTRAAVNEGRGAARFGRLASRALFVLGSAVAGTAAAWVISGASASADTVATPVTDATVASMNEAAHGASQFAGDVSGTAAAALRDVHCFQDATTWSAPDCSAPGQIGGPARQHAAHRVMDHEVSERVSDSVADLAENTVVKPAQGTLGAVEHIARKPEDARQVLGEAVTPSPEAAEFGQKFWQLLDPNSTGDLVTLPRLPGSLPVEPVSPMREAGQVTETAETTAVPLTAAVQAALAAPDAAQQAALPGKPRTGSSNDDHRDFPLPFSPMQLPLAPVSIPTVPGGGSAPGGHFDGLTSGVPAWAVSAVDNAMAGTVRAGVRRMPLTPGSQPGVTPD
ncbi:hypothetical protein [Amycolatopsis sp. H20-H5]|uniref:hypothetical protein n=1 Tax=Amycolatopsis sp. H20-H5 TaxID=3046309 RepID=UPI002DB61F61|nr:hypothetical protein [Amycolatopsis sp. H20-H5]MEC3974666.1 hypothetical protein [Amycolatopsis sp. H20-H5]